MLLKKQKLLTASPALTRECTPGSRLNSRKTMKLSPPREMSSNSPAFCAAQCLLANQSGKEP